MKPHFKLVLGVPLASAMLFAQSYTYTGDIVNANCYLASRIVNRNSRGYTPFRGASTFNSATRETVPNPSPRQKKSILLHFSINPDTTPFPFLNYAGNFLNITQSANPTFI